LNTMGVEKIKVTRGEADAEMPSQFTHSIKIEETAKGVRLSVHIYASDRVTAIEEAIGTYEVMAAALDGEEIPRAPMEIVKKVEDK
jgi:hypothetical protein